MYELTEDVVKHLKDTNPGVKLYKKNIAGQDYVYKYLTNEDYKHILEWVSQFGARINNEALDEKIVSYGKMWPDMTLEEVLTLPAGVYVTLSKAIQEASCLPTEDSPMDYLNVEELNADENLTTLSEKDAELLKSSYNYKLTKVNVYGNDFVVRPLIRSEFNAIQKKALADANLDIELETVKQCLVFPKLDEVQVQKVRAGIVGILSNQVMVSSGFDSGASVVETL